MIEEQDRKNLTRAICPEDPAAPPTYLEVAEDTGAVLWMANEESNHFYYVGRGGVEFVNDEDQKVVFTYETTPENPAFLLGFEEFILKMPRKYTCRVASGTEKTYLAKWDRSWADNIFSANPKVLDALVEFAGTKADFLPSIPPKKTTTGTDKKKGTAEKKKSEKEENPEKKKSSEEKPEKKKDFKQSKEEQEEPEDENFSKRFFHSLFIQIKKKIPFLFWLFKL